MSAAEHDGEEWPSAVTPESGQRPKPGDIIIDPDLAMAPEPLVGDDLANALEEDEAGVDIPEGPLLAMKDRRHTQWHLLASHERHERLREVYGKGDVTLYVIDDGRSHAMIGRVVGSSPSCAYSLVGRVSREALETLKTAAVPLDEAFDTAEELALVGLAQVEAVASSNVFDVAFYATPAEVPSEYLPGHAAIRFGSDLEITAY
jgi:hypothetical protein